jgi:hypothetical protein
VKGLSRSAIGALALVGLLAASAFAPAGASAAPPFLWQGADTGSGAGQTQIPRGVAVAPASAPNRGHLFVADQRNSRVVELDPWGVFVRAWGWGVVASGPGDEPRNEIQEVTVDATAGSFRISLNFEQITGDLPFDASAAAVQAALEALGNEPLPTEPGDFSVTGPDGGPWEIEFTGANADTDIPEASISGSTLSGGTGASIATTQPGANFEVCVAVDGDVCRGGQVGPAPGQFELSSPQGVAVDSAGYVYVVDRGLPSNQRVQKFSPEGEFELMFGGGVNQGGGTPANPGDVCTAEHLENGDTCGAGAEGADPGEFGDWVIVGSYIAVGPGDRVYVGDVGRIQYFDADGELEDQINEGIGPAERIKALAVGPSGIVYAAIEGVEGVRRWSPFPDHDQLATIEVEDGETPQAPLALAVDGEENIYAITGSAALIHKLDADGDELESWGQEEPPVPKFGGSTGIAASSACLNGGEGANVYVSNAVENDSFVRAYGPPPDFVLPPGSGLCEPPPVVPPAIEAQRALEVGNEEAVVAAEINPLFWPDARYYVQYGTGECSEPGGCPEQQPVPPGLLLTDEVLSESIISAPIFLGGLEPGTTYNFRFVAQSSGGGPVYGTDPDGDGPKEASFEEGLEGTFTTFGVPPPPPPCANDEFRLGTPGELLPECRAYELVSPAEKNGADAIAPNNVALLPEEEAHFRASPDGERVSYASTVAFGDARAGPFSVGYVASRSGGGWSTHGILPPQGTNIDINTPVYAWNHVLGLSEDLSSTWLYTDSNPPPPGGVPDYRNLYRCDNASDECAALTTEAPESHAPGQSFKPWLAGYSADGSASAYVANDALVDGASTATAGGKPIYQVYAHRAGEGLSLVSRLPVAEGGGASDQPSFVGGGIESLDGAVSEDGERIYWTTGSLLPLGESVAEGGSISGRIYLSERGAGTIAVSPAAQVARFWVGARDGSAALYTVGGDLFRFEQASATSTPIAEGVLGVGGAAEDLSRVYFVSTAVLDAAPNSKTGETALAGQGNVYLYEEGEGIRFVARPNVNGASGFASPIYADGIDGLPNRLSRVSADGSALLFVAYNSLTGYDNTIDGQPYMQVYRYGAEEDRVECVSCNTAGAQAMGREDETRKPFISAKIPGWRQGPLYEQRALSDDGDRVYFESFDRLAAADTNERLDVYQWRAPDTGECDTGDASFSDRNGGCVDLISTGASDTDSHFIEATPDGKTVFLRTTQRLVGLDRDNLFDIYAARIGGGLAAQYPPPDPPFCTPVESCPGGGSVPPPEVGAGSAAFVGPGNPPARGDCAKAMRLARKHRRAAKSLRRRSARLARAAGKSASPDRSRAARRKAARLAAKAKRHAAAARKSAKRAKRCRKAQRAGANGRAGK